MEEQLKQHINILNDRVQKINTRLFVNERATNGNILFKGSFADDSHHISIKDIFTDKPYIAEREGTSLDDWQAIPHRFVLKIVEEWIEEFSDVVDYPFESNQVRLNIKGETCRILKDEHRRYTVWNITQNRFEVLPNNTTYSYDPNKSSMWAKYFPTVVSL